MGADALISAQSSSVYQYGNVFTDNTCNDVCVDTVESVLSINIIAATSNVSTFSANYNFLRVDSGSASNSTVCINTADKTFAVDYVSFSDDSSTANTKLIFDDGHVCSTVDAFEMI